MPLTAGQAEILLHGEIRALLMEHATTRKVIEAIPADRAGFKPDEVSKSALELAWHLVSSEHFFLRGAATGKFDTDGPPEAAGRTPASISAWYAERFAEDIERLKQVPGEQLLGLLDFKGIVRMSALSFVQLARSHAIHHRGQLSMYLRPMGARVPSIYGESYDAKRERENALKQ